MGRAQSDVPHDCQNLPFDSLRVKRNPVYVAVKKLEHNANGMKIEAMGSIHIFDFAGFGLLV